MQVLKFPLARRSAGAQAACLGADAVCAGDEPVPDLCVEDRDFLARHGAPHDIDARYVSLITCGAVMLTARGRALYAAALAQVGLQRALAPLRHVQQLLDLHAEIHAARARQAAAAASLARQRGELPRGWWAAADALADGAAAEGALLAEYAQAGSNVLPVRFGARSGARSGH
ncbi:hypothetical protein RA210_U60109 [Rubrivivax sp. A210]|uniref:hypothetical protein n=1 Tax=Rubrivivax sp. A210 TaxID=2772301 RepID=UPI0019192912|nr:hypothetical protein [Rubrivivax sp. A210]CAD5374530.1 hypothetical protein RA210_U60109 [Rubrivivax sp. A210]